MDVNKKKSDIGMKTVKDYLEKEGYECTDVTKRMGFIGFDILAKKDGKEFKIEVKTSSKEKGVPDCYTSEFDKNNNLISDFLYIVRLDKKDLSVKRIEILTKEEIDRYAPKHNRVERVRMASKLKTDLRNGKVGKVISNL